MFTRGIFFCLILIVLESPGVAQQIEIINKETGAPVDNVALFNKSRNISTLSDKKGIADIEEFNIEDTIYFQHPSYEIIRRTKDELIQSDGKILLKQRNILMDEFVISAYKNIERKQDIPFMIEVLEPKKIDRSAYQTSADILLETGAVYIQKSQSGGGSPILRGFEANKILLVVDGIRMNNAIYRNGHLQNSITIDNSVLERVEVLFGPSSIIYGSDALGGVIHYYTKSPEFSKTALQSYIQYSTANEGKVIHADFNVGKKKIANLFSVTYHDFEDAWSGKKRKDDFGDWGLTPHYVTRINGMDTMVRNPDPELQKNTGYNQLDLINKLKFNLLKKVELVFNLQYSTSSNINRYDQLNDYDGEYLIYSDWYYGPQNRFLGAIQAQFKQDNRLFTNLTTTLAYQKVDEDRITRRFREDNKMHQEEDVYVYSLNLDFLKMTRPQRRLHYGLDITHNDVISSALYENISTGSISPATSRYPDGGSHTNSFSFYTNYKWSIKNKYIFNGGLRYNYDMLKSLFSDPQIPFERISIHNGALTGSISLVYHPQETWQFNIIGSTGFRNPNVDDYGKIRAKGTMITVPNDDIKPEYTYNIEVGSSKKITGYARFDVVFFYSVLSNAIVRSEYQLNGSDSLMYDGKMYKIVANTNATLATIKGVSIILKSDFNNPFEMTSTLNYTHGRDQTNDQPLGHIAPLFGRTEFSYTFLKKFYGAANIMYSGLKAFDDMSSFGEDNEVEALEGTGFPGWTTVNFRSVYYINDNLQVQVALENLFDKYYKPFASGLAGAGRNFILTFRATI